MKKLPSNFELEKDGIIARLVCEEDASFILNLRCDPKRGQFLHATEPDIESQKQWIREYKQREIEGREYYFIFFKGDKRFGLHRIYNIDWEHLSFTMGSWICSADSSLEQVEATALIPLEVAFDILGLLIFTLDVKKDNREVLNFYRRTHCLIEYGETEHSVLFYSSKALISHLLFPEK